MFYTESPGVGGRIKQRIEDFIVEEVPPRKSDGDKTDEYIIFWLEKFNWDTNQILKLIAKKLHVSENRMRIAGTKDKRALTRQRVSVWDPDKALEKKLSEVRIKDIKIYNITRGNRLRLGELEGNKFAITIREISLTEEEIKSRIEKIFEEMKGEIPNIFGPQRFGETRPITAVVGKEMLKDNFENAVKTYLADYFEAEPDDAKKARRLLSENWNLEGFKKSLGTFPYRLKNERSMLGYLCEHPNDFAGALRRLPKRLRKMFLNAYQAEMWNTVAEERYAEAKSKNEKIKNASIPLVGYDTELDDENAIHKKLIAMLKRDKIRLSDFALKGMPELKCNGGERDFLLFPKGLKLLAIADDEFNAGKKSLQISFQLPKGSYATVVLKEIMK
ncbi:MAG: tRNA pseudouridine(13) synthase TruD [Candidatus Aenigmatarchaeota archaeon]